MRALFGELILRWPLEFVAYFCCAFLCEGPLAISERAPDVVLARATRARDGYVAAKPAIGGACGSQHSWWLR